jgi:molybdate/tungstate transport system substrate-binding protein
VRLAERITCPVMNSRRRSLGLLVFSLVLAACGGLNKSDGTGIPRQHAGHGTATVAAAGSLEGVVQTSLQPAFEKESGDRFVAKFEGSSAIAQAINDGELNPGAFVSVGRTAIEKLWPSRSHFVMTLATDPLVVAYSPKSRYAPELNRVRQHRAPLSSLFRLFERPGFRLGRTDPNLDPQGGFFILMCELAERDLHLPKGTANRILGTSDTNTVGSSSQIVDEAVLPTDLQSATFDAGSEFLTEALQYHLDYIALPASLDFADPRYASSYSSLSLELTGGVVFRGGLITLDDTYVLPPKGQPISRADAKADASWLSFLISPRGRHLLAKAGYVLQRPQLSYASGYSNPKAVLPPVLLSQYQRSG